MIRPPHQNVATVLVDPSALRDLEYDLVAHDLWVWPIATAQVYADGRRAAFQVRRRLVEARRGEWDLAADWVPVWIAFGAGWYDGEEPLPWTARATLYACLDRHAAHVRYRKGLGGVRRLRVLHEGEAS